MNFEKALENIKAGKSVRRSGWNGSGLSVQAQFPDAHSKMTMPYIFIQYPNTAKTTPNGRCPWVPSISDIFAEDWELT